MEEQTTVVGAICGVVGIISGNLFGWWKYKKKSDEVTAAKTQEISISDRQKLTEEQRKRIASLEAELNRQTAFWTGKLETLTERFDSRIREMDGQLDKARDETYKVREQLAIQSQMVTFAQEKFEEFQRQINSLKQREAELQDMVAELHRLNAQKDDKIAAQEEKIAAQDLIIHTLQTEVSILKSHDQHAKEK